MAIKTRSSKDFDTLFQMQGLYKQMVQAFRDLGVEAVPGVGHPFDPNFHEAIMHEPNDDVPDGTILQEFRKGFQCGDRLLRAAMVKVTLSCKPQEAIALPDAMPAAFIPKDAQHAAYVLL